MNESQSRPKQQELPLAIVGGTPIMVLPHDLYIPPEALEVFLETFEGPLDLLLYLIKKQNIDILDIPIAKITSQYMQYVDKMRQIQFELAAEYLVMAAMLAEIKSRLLLPQTTADDEDDVDPRAELVRRLQEYEQFKQAAEDLDQLPRLERDIFPLQIYHEACSEKQYAEVALDELLKAMKAVLARADKFSRHHIEKESLSVKERMSDILDTLQQARKQSLKFVVFSHLFHYREGRSGVVVSFLAILELAKQGLIEIVQNEPFGVIHVSCC